MEFTKVVSSIFLLLTLNSNQNVFCAISRFYENSVEYEYDCSVEFDYPRRFDCACIDGLWKLYGSKCDEIFTIAGKNQHCFAIPDIEIIKAERLLLGTNQILIQKASQPSILITNPQDKNSNLIQLSVDDEIILGTDWTVEDDIGKQVCLICNPDSYCFFEGLYTEVGIITSITKGCKEGAKSVNPLKYVLRESESKNVCKSGRFRRDVVRTGRVFFGAPGRNRTVYAPPGANPVDEDTETPTATTTAPVAAPDASNATAAPGSPGESGAEAPDAVDGPIPSSVDDVTLAVTPDPDQFKYDEDFFNATDTNRTEVSDDVASEIYNILDAKFDELLGLTEPYKAESKGSHKSKRSARRKVKGAKGSADQGKPKSAKKRNIYRAPVFLFLEITKEIMQRTCPPHYVNPNFFDIAVTAFINMQKAHFKFPQGIANFHGYQRILESLENCLANATAFNFTTDTCPSRSSTDTLASGKYCSFGDCSELNVKGDFDSYDPLIDTVWSIFKNSHALCFGFFEKRFNDHHRFATWMVRLFQNQINKTWKNGTAIGQVYGGVLGNQEIVQASIAYCTTSSLLMSKYPWDLPRPDYIPDLDNFAGRKKRDVDSLSVNEPMHATRVRDISATCVAAETTGICRNTQKSTF